MEQWGGAKHEGRVVLLWSESSKNLPARLGTLVLGTGVRAMCPWQLGCHSSGGWVLAYLRYTALSPFLPSGEPRPPGGPGSQSLVNIYHSFKTLVHAGFGLPPTHKCPHSMLPPWSAEGPSKARWVPVAYSPIAFRQCPQWQPQLYKLRTETVAQINSQDLLPWPVQTKMQHALHSGRSSVKNNKSSQRSNTHRLLK